MAALRPIGGLASLSPQHVLVDSRDATSTINDFLINSQRINGETFGRHARSSAFSTHLSGRFYKNSTLEAHASRKKRAARMRVKKRELEQAILVEERRVELLEEKLRERKAQCRQIRQRRLLAAVTIQGLVRKRAAIHRVEGMRRRIKTRTRIAHFGQARYRGAKGRERARLRRMDIAQFKKEHLSSIRIQCLARSCAAREVLRTKQEERRMRCNATACTIQSAARMRQCRKRYNNMVQEKQQQLRIRRESASMLIQTIYRRHLARIETERRRLEKLAEEARTKRVPLHMRRYSMYSVSASQVASIAVSAASGMRRNNAAVAPVKFDISTGSDSSVDSDTRQGQIREARQRAAARVAEKGREDRRMRSEKEERELAAKSRVAKLEEKRKQILQKTRKASAAASAAKGTPIKDEPIKEKSASKNVKGNEGNMSREKVDNEGPSPRDNRPQKKNAPIDQMKQPQDPSTQKQIPPNKARPPATDRGRKRNTAPLKLEFQAAFDEDLTECEDDLG